MTEAGVLGNSLSESKEEPPAMPGIADTWKQHVAKSSNAPCYSLGCQGLTHTSGCERHPFQPTVPTAITLQLPQTTTQSHPELPATWLGNEDSTQRPALLH